MTNTKNAKNAKLYECVFCSFITHNLTDYKRHINTKKHISMTMAKTANEKTPLFHCLCGKVYKHQTSLCKHKRQCTHKQNNVLGDSELTPKNSELTEVDSAYTCEFCGNILSKNSNLRRHYTRCKVKKEIETLKKEKQDLQNLVIDTLQNQVEEKDKQIKELIPKVGNVTNNFNFNNFLNEQCKDAITIEAFVESIKISLGQLLLTQKEGVTSGISNLITENMNKLAINERPIHCSDKKREVLYVKNDTWDKDCGKKHTKQMIDTLCTKQLKSVNSLIENNDGDYVNIINKCTSNVNEKKVMKNICDTVYVNEI